jgi:ribonuclease HI
LDEFCQLHNSSGGITWNWVKGHANDADNIRVDKLAREGTARAIEHMRMTKDNATQANEDGVIAVTIMSADCY